MRHPSKPHANHQAADALATPDPAATTSASAAPTETTLATFDGTDGEYPIGELVLDGRGDLFGVTSEGGSSNDGTVFEESSGQITDLYSFTAANGDGDFPYASLSMDASGNLYGTTEYGGTSGGGTVFKLTSHQGGSYSYQTIAQLRTSTGDGYYPASGVYVEPDGTITGTTTEGGANGTGTVFTIAANGSPPVYSTPVYTSLPAANGSNTYEGPLPLSAPIEIGTSLYSTTYGDGSTTNPGTIFAFNTQTSTISTLATFNAATGYSPESGVVADSMGNLYGITTQGTGSGYGSIYEYNASKKTIQVLASFNSATGYASQGNLLRDGAGDLFGTTYAGGADSHGTVFELKAGSSTINVLYNFTDGTDGSYPQGGLVADAMGNLYGTTAYDTVYEIQNAGFVPVCFAAGTRIRTARGDIAVEALAAGDRVVTASGAPRPIRWLGHRTLDCRRHPSPREAKPIRVTAHAFGENRPERDLFLSPGHSVCVDFFGEVLIPIGRLTNGATIAQVDVDEVTYWHVELDAHDIIFAENLACESYIDCGTRAFFAESDVVDLGASPDAPVLTTDDYCRPFHPDGALVNFARERLCLRADDLGWRLEVADPLGGLWLEVDGQRVVPQCDGLVARIALPATVREIFLCSDSAVPADIHGGRDERRLGLQFASVVADDGLHWRCEMACTDARLVDGFHTHEGTHRWTDGRARLPAELWAGARDMFVLRLAFAGPALPLWVAPVDAVAAAARNVAA